MPPISRPARLPRLRDDARPVGRTGRAAHEAFIREQVAAGDTEQEIRDALVAEFGPAVLATPPPRSGFGLLAWLVPLGVLVAGALAVGVLVFGWSRRRRAPATGPPLDPELERRVDEGSPEFEELTDS